MDLTLIAPINNMTYNIRLAKALDVHSAIYLSVLLNFQQKESNKEDNRVKLSREEIYNMTAITDDEQEQIESRLRYVKLIKMWRIKNSSARHYYEIDMQCLMQVLDGKQEELSDNIKHVKELYKENKKPTKSECIINNLKKHVTIEDEKAREYLFEWIKAAVAKYGHLTKFSVEDMCNDLIKYSKNSNTVLYNLCRIAAKYGYRSSVDIIRYYKKEYNINDSDIHIGCNPNNTIQADVDKNIKELREHGGEVF